MRVHPVAMTLIRTFHPQTFHHQKLNKHPVRVWTGLSTSLKIPQGHLKDFHIFCFELQNELYPLTYVLLLVRFAPCAVAWSRLYGSSQVISHSAFHFIFFKTAGASLLSAASPQGTMMMSRFPVHSHSLPAPLFLTVVPFHVAFQCLGVSILQNFILSEGASLSLAILFSPYTFFFLLLSLQQNLFNVSFLFLLPFMLSALYLFFLQWPLQYSKNVLCEVFREIEKNVKKKEKKKETKKKTPQERS